MIVILFFYVMAWLRKNNHFVDDMIPAFLWPHVDVPFGEALNQVQNKPTSIVGVFIRRFTVLALFTLTNKVTSGEQWQMIIKASDRGDFKWSNSKMLPRPVLVADEYDLIHNLFWGKFCVNKLCKFFQTIQTLLLSLCAPFFHVCGLNWLGISWRKDKLPPMQIFGIHGVTVVNIYAFFSKWIHHHLFFVSCDCRYGGISVGAVNSQVRLTEAEVEDVFRGLKNLLNSSQVRHKCLHWLHQIGLHGSFVSVSNGSETAPQS